MGPQDVTVSGVRPGSHFARVMVGADYLMKRIAMGLDRSPVAGVPSFLQLLRRAPATGQLMAPRWWIATDYETVEKSRDGLAWRFDGRGVKVMSEHGYLDSHGELVNAGRPSPLASLWATKFTDRYDDLAREVTAFGQLRGCVDLAVFAALITQESLLEVGNCPLTAMTDPGRLVGEKFSVPRQVASIASAQKGRSGWIVSVSGGVDLDTWNVLKKVEVNPDLETLRAKQAADAGQRWWWD